jgi:hypothetical protein
LKLKNKNWERQEEAALPERREAKTVRVQGERVVSKEKQAPSVGAVKRQAAKCLVVVRPNDSQIEEMQEMQKKIEQSLSALMEKKVGRMKEE